MAFMTRFVFFLSLFLSDVLSMATAAITSIPIRLDGDAPAPLQLTHWRRPRI